MFLTKPTYGILVKSSSKCGRPAQQPLAVLGQEQRQQSQRELSLPRPLMRTFLALASCSCITSLEHSPGFWEGLGTGQEAWQGSVALCTPS